MPVTRIATQVQSDTPESAALLSIKNATNTPSINKIQYLAVSGTSTQSSAVTSATNKVFITSNTNCWIAFGSNPTATKQTANNLYIPAGVLPYPLLVTPGNTKIAVIQDSVAGVVSILESV